jgi:hypothetical protein
MTLAVGSLVAGAFLGRGFGFGTVNRLVSASPNVWEVYTAGNDSYIMAESDLAGLELVQELPAPGNPALGAVCTENVQTDVQFGQTGVLHVGRGSAESVGRGVLFMYARWLFSPPGANDIAILYPLDPASPFLTFLPGALRQIDPPAP